MKNIICLTLIGTVVQASSLMVIKERDEKKDILHLMISSKGEINCKEKTDYKLNNTIICGSDKFDNNITLNKEFDFFDLNINDKQVTIIPKTNYKLIGRNKKIFSTIKFKKENHHFVDLIFYKNEPSYLNIKGIHNSLSFNIDFKKNSDPIVEVLDDSLFPVNSSLDANKLNFVKKLFMKKDYESVINKVDREILKGNIFASDLQLYKIRAIVELLKDKKEMDFSYTDLLNASNLFIQQFPSNKNITEVFYYKILSLYNIGKYKKASQIVAKLNDSFPNNIFSQKALILKAKNLMYKNKLRKTSYSILENLLYNTKNVNVALESAYELVGLNLQDKNVKDAKEFLEKIIKFDKEYLKKDKKRSYRYAKRFAELKSYPEAVKIAEILAKNSKDEDLLKDLAFWQEKANMKDLAYKNYKKYLKDFPDGRYVAFVKENMDKVLLDLNETNQSKKINDIEDVLKKYPNAPIYKKAFLKKLKLLMSEKKYKEILSLEEKIKDINATSYIDDASKRLFEKYLKNNDCISAVHMVDKYRIRVNKNSLYRLAVCYYDLARYKESYELTSKYIKSQNDSELVKWYELAIKSLVRLNNYGKAIELYGDLVKLNDLNNFSIDLYINIYKSYFNLKYIDKALEIVKKIELKSPTNPKLLDIYFSLVKYYNDQKIDLMTINFAKKLLKLQKKLKVQTYSPLVDIIIIKSLKNLKKYKEALSYFADAYLSKNITDTQKAQLLYLAGDISVKMKNIKQAREFFIKCGTDVKSDMWQKLCSDSLKLLEQ